jgi:site-specific DNA-methyltransferase (adenine-specific)
MDCMEFMKDIPDKFYDLAICDPPYGIGLVKTKNGSWGIRKPEQAENASKDFDWDFAKPTKEYIVELFRVSKNQILFGANHYIEVVPYNSPCWLVWDKVNGESYFADCELAWTSFETATRKIKLQYFGANSHRFGKRIHPTQKPVGLYEYILENYAKEGDKILDTHGGSQSSRIACYNLGYELDIIELDQEYFDQGNKRFEEHKQQLRLF